MTLEAIDSTFDMESTSQELARAVLVGECEKVVETQQVTLGMDLAAGTVAGMAQIAAGHPFDTIKVRLQTQALAGGKFAGPMDCFRQTVRQEGFRGLFKGMGPPLAGVGVVNAVLFAAYGQARNVLLKLDGRGEEGGDLTIGESVLAGSFAGLVNCLVICPVELVKLRLQTQYGSGTASAIYRGPWDCVRHIARTEGTGQLFRGMYGTIMREIPAYGAYFGSYELAKYALMNDEERRAGSASPLKTFVAGGLGGVGCWLFSYPQDLIKSVLQDQRDSTTYKRKFLDGGFWDCAKRIYRSEGHRGFWKGFAPCILRSFPANAATFLAYEMCVKFLKDVS